MFGIEKCLIYTGLINKDFLNWDFKFKFGLYTGFHFIQGSV